MSSFSTDTTSQLLTSAEAAERLRISRRTLERYRVMGTGPGYLKVGPGKRARVLYRAATLDSWLTGYAFNSTSEYGQ
jgi:Helix-turn-helix domain